MSTGNRRYIHPAQKELIVSMAGHMNAAEIARVTHISQRTVRRVVALWRETGKVERKPEIAGRPGELNSDDIAVGGSLAGGELQCSLFRGIMTLTAPRGDGAEDPGYRPVRATRWTSLRTGLRRG